MDEAEAHRFVETRAPAMTAVIFANLSGTVRIKSPASLSRQIDYR
jgi:hypothetical protein